MKIARVRHYFAREASLRHPLATLAMSASDLLDATASAGVSDNTVTLK